MKSIKIKFSGHGHWKIAMIYRGKEISTTTTNSVAIDHYNSEDGEKWGRELRKLKGYKALKAEILRAKDL